MSRREAAKEERRCRILDVAEQMIRERGGAGLSMRSLAAQAGVAFVTPFNLFENKAGVLLALVEKRIDAQIDRPRPLVDSAEPLEALFEQAVVGSRAYAADPELYRPLLMAIAATDKLDHQRIASRSTELWLVVIGAAVDQGRISPDVDLARFARSLHASFRTVLMLWAEGLLDGDELEMQCQIAVACAALPALDNQGAEWALQRVRALEPSG